LLKKLYLLEQFYHVGSKVWVRNDGVKDMYLKSMVGDGHDRVLGLDQDIAEYLLVRDRGNRNAPVFNVLWENGHLYSIRSISNLSNRFICHKCGTLYPSSTAVSKHHFNVHEKTVYKKSYCENENLPMVGRESLFELLSKVRCKVSEDLVKTLKVGAKHSISWDCEAILKKTGLPDYQQIHELSIISITHNIHDDVNDDSMTTEHFHTLEERHNNPNDMVKRFFIKNQ
jgi:hypothetical protein